MSGPSTPFPRLGPGPADWDAVEKIKAACIADGTGWPPPVSYGRNARVDALDRYPAAPGEPPRARDVRSRRARDDRTSPGEAPPADPPSRAGSTS